MQPMKGLRRWAIWAGVLWVSLLLTLIFVGSAGAAYSASTWVVTSTGDSGPGTLRQAIADAASGDVIVFDASLSGATINLTSGQLEIDKNLVIDGSDVPGVTISGDGLSRIFAIAHSVSVELRDLTMTNGRAPDGTIPAGEIEEQSGGAIYNQGSLSLMGCTVTENQAGDGKDGVGFAPGGHGGGIFSIGSLTIENSHIAYNVAGDGANWACPYWSCSPMPDQTEADGGSGGGVYSAGPLTVVSSTIESNVAGANGVFREISHGGDGGGIFSLGITLIYSSSVTGNKAGGSDRCLGEVQEGCGGGRGGGVASLGTLAVSNSLFSDNTAGIGSPGGDGGGIYAQGTVQVVSTSITYNSGGIGTRYRDSPPFYGAEPGRPGGCGGGISVHDGELRLSASEVISNSAGAGGDSDPGPWPPPGETLSSTPARTGGDGGTGGHGGGVFASDSYVVIETSSINLNAAGQGGRGGWGAIIVGAGGVGGTGGGIRAENLSYVRIHGTTLAGNLSGNGGHAYPSPYDGQIRPGNAGGGAGIYNDLSAVEITNSTLSGNVTGIGPLQAEDGNGGGLYHESGWTVIRHSTIAENQASGTGSGGGMWGEVSIVLEDTLLSGNQAGGVGPDCTGPVSLSAGNLIENPRDCALTGSVGAAILDQPALIGPLALNAPGSTETHALLPDSPAVNTGSCSDGAITTDQRGVPRPQGAACDIGAYEFGPLAVDWRPIYFPLIAGR